MHWASIKSFKPKGSSKSPGSGNAWSDFKGEKRSNDTHESTTDPEAKQIRKASGQEAGRMSFAGHATMRRTVTACAYCSRCAAPSACRNRRSPWTRRVELKNCGASGPKRSARTRGYHIEGVREHRIVPHPAFHEKRDPNEECATAAMPAILSVRTSEGGGSLIDGAYGIPGRLR